MTVHLYLAPAGAGKSDSALHIAKEAVRDLAGEARVCVASQQQARSWRRRLALSGGALGVRVMTFDQLYADCLSAAGEIYAGLSRPDQYRLLQLVVEEAPLAYYRPLAGRSGFVLLLQAFVDELKAARIWPSTFQEAIAGLGEGLRPGDGPRLGEEPRLRELGLIYAAYQEHLLANKWADFAGRGWLAVEALEKAALEKAALEDRAASVAADWPLLIFDGFDSFTQVQLDLMAVLARRVKEVVITLTGDTTHKEPRRAHGRYHETRQRLEGLLGVTATGLPLRPSPASGTPRHPALVHLEANLFVDGASRVDGDDAVTLIEAPDEAAEVRAALRWLKQRLLVDGLEPQDVALLARDILPYQPFIIQTAAEFGLPVRLTEGLPLNRNPAVAALLDLLRLVLPEDGDAGALPLPRRGVVAAWRSPYFDWTHAYVAEGDPEPIGITAADAEALDVAARWGRVIGGIDQWKEALYALANRDPEESKDEELQIPANVVTGPPAEALVNKFVRFLVRLTPPFGRTRTRHYVSWLEDLMGPDPAGALPEAEISLPTTSLNVVACARQASGPAADQDVAALQAFKEILRSLVWADERIEAGRGKTFERFFADLAGTVEAATYQPPADPATEPVAQPAREEILVTNVVQARGLPLQAAAVLGMAEGVFPATLGEDPLLRERDRRWFRQSAGLPLEPSIASPEREFFYEAVTRPGRNLLLTRPRLTETGAEWLPSPFWEEIRRLVDVEPVVLGTDSVPGPEEAASWPELVESLAVLPDGETWLPPEEAGRWEALVAAAGIFRGRYERRPAPFDGHLSALAGSFAARFHPDYGWSPSALESYRTCPFSFFTGRVLRLEARPEPAEGLDSAQLGTLYHRILEALYRAVDPADRTDAGRLLAALPTVARPILDEAPRREGFRATAWWQQTRTEILENVGRSIRALAEMAGDFRPSRFEARFFERNVLSIYDEDGNHFVLHGIIDRVDLGPKGQVRIIDYKTAGPASYGKNTLEQGRKLQLPLYALAARDALGLGQPVDGFYWHVRHAEPSGLRLADYGPEAAIETAVAYAWEAVRGARDGEFEPAPPADGCPSYCPAVAFCWRYSPGWWGS